MFNRSLLTTIDCDIEHEVWLDSRFHCAWEKTIVSVVLDPLYKQIVVYTEPAEASGKRSREGVTNIMRTPKVRLSDGSVRVYEAEWLGMGGSAPHVGVRLDPTLGCVAKIVHAGEK
eukprot:gene14719-21356_t